MPASCGRVFVYASVADQSDSEALMARRANPTPQPPVLTPDQMRRRMDDLQRCIAELEAFDSQLIQKRYNIAQVVALETSITDAFGHRTPRLKLFEDAARLD